MLLFVSVKMTAAIGLINLTLLEEAEISLFLGQLYVKKSAG